MKHIISFLWFFKSSIIPEQACKNVLAIFIFFSIVQSATYYISTGGNDSNSGTVPGTPWHHCPGMQGWSGGGSLSAGDTVFFNSGNTWEVTGGTAVLQVTGGVVYDGRTWGSGTRAVFRAKADLSRSVIAILKDHETIPTVVRGFEADAGGTITSGIGINHPQMENPVIGAVKRIEDCIIHDVMSYSAQNTYKYGIVISNWNGEYHVKNVEVINCKVYNISRGGINLYPGNDIPGNLVENVLVRGNEIWNTGMDPDYAGSCLAIKNQVVNAVVEYNYVHDPIRGGGIGVSTHPEEGFIGPKNAIVRHNIIANSKHAGMYITSWGPISLAIYGNIVMNSTYQAFNLTDKLLDSLSIKIYNNTLINNYSGSPWAEQIRIVCKDATVTALEVSNNLIYSTDSARAMLDDYGLLTAHANNLYYKSIGGTLVITNGTTYTASNITTWEPGSITAHPLFNDTSHLPAGFTGTYGSDLKPNTDGLSITESSPAKDKGAALGDNYKTSINTVSRPYASAWDIGAYEYNGIISIYPNKKIPSIKRSMFHVTKTSAGILFSYTGTLKNTTTLNIFDLAGTLIRQLTLHPSSGPTSILWDRHDSRGRQSPSGCYTAQLRTVRNTLTQRVILTDN